MIGLMVIGLMVSPREEQAYLVLINLHVIVVCYLPLTSNN